MRWRYLAGGRAGGRAPHVQHVWLWPRAGIKEASLGLEALSTAQFSGIRSWRRNEEHSL